MHARKWWLALTAALALTLGLVACGDEEAERELPFAQELQDALDAGLEEHGGMGISAAVIVPGYRTWVGASGVSHETTPMTPDTLFSAGSITKMFAATLVLQLAEEGVLTLDDPLHKWLPDYPNIDNTITIRQLLNHTSGVYDYVEHPDAFETFFADPARSWRPEEILTTFVLEPYFPKGTGWHYSNTGYALVEMIVREATGSEAYAELRKRFWSPLRLDSTFLDGEDAIPGNVAHGWSDDWPDMSGDTLGISGDGEPDDLSSLPRTAPYGSWGLAAAMISTPEDLARWSQALYHERRVLSQESLDEMLTFHSPTPGEPRFSGYGLGVGEISPALTQGLEMWGHGGSVHGYTAIVGYLPEYGASIAAMVNFDSYGVLVDIGARFLSLLQNHLEKTR